jgi:hypothetical protein
MVGYQGWFRTPDDGTGLGWTHYAGPRTHKFEPGSAGIDFWPDTSELSPAEKSATPFRFADGSVATVFSSHSPATVDRHFRWMREYGIDGAFLQRFPSEFIAGNPPALARRRVVDDVIGYARAAAEHQGRAFVIMYDLSGVPAGAMDRVKSDWRHLVDDLRVRASPAYQYHRGRPLVALWGIGFNDHRAYTLSDCADLIAFLKDDPVYGGNAVMLGVPTGWREQRGDAVSDIQLHDVLRAADLVSPWTPGRYRDLAGIRAHAEKYWFPDRAWCAERGLDYLPVVFPGFSWRNLKGATTSIDRLDGRFLWEQYRQLANHGVTMVYQAMFDEMDEGTQIFKTAPTPPAHDNFASYAPLPSDYYLWLVGTAARYVHTGAKIPDRIVDRPWHFADNRYLRAHDDQVYGAAAAPVPAR